MSLDGALLHCVKEELSALVGARVEKVRMPSREEIVITLRILSGSGKGSRDVIFSANSAAARVHIATFTSESPKQPPMLCMLLRKRLGGGKLSAVRQDGLERILFLDFDCVNEIGDPVVYTIAAEIMGRNSNIILLSGGKIVESIRHVPDSPRRVLPNMEYELPPRKERLNILECSVGEVIRELESRSGRLAKALPEILEGISPVFAREAAFRACGDVDAACGLSDTEKARLAEFLDEAKEALGGQGGKFVLITDDTGKKRDFSFVRIEQYENAVRVSEFPTASALLEDFYSEESGSERRRQRSRELMKTLNTAYERALRKLELRKKELSECASREELKMFGDLINANIFRLEKGMTKCTLENFYGSGTVEIPLDARLTPQQNAQKYYAEYRKLDNAEKKLSELIESGAAEVGYLDSVLDSASRAQSDEELSEIKRELAEQGYLRLPKDDKSRGAKQKPTEPLEFKSSDGYEILVGRNNRQNDLLTLKTARAADLWLHTKNIAGSHVIVKNPDGGTVPEKTITEAAILAAYHSRARSSSGVPVDCTAVRFVKKPAGAKPGMVIFTNNRTLYVTPDEEAVNSLKDNRKEQHQ